MFSPLNFKDMIEEYEYIKSEIKKRGISPDELKFHLEEDEESEFYARVRRFIIAASEGEDLDDNYAAFLKIVYNLI